MAEPQRTVFANVPWEGLGQINKLILTNDNSTNLSNKCSIQQSSLRQSSIQQNSSQVQCHMLYCLCLRRWYCVIKEVKIDTWEPSMRVYE